MASPACARFQGEKARFSPRNPERPPGLPRTVSLVDEIACMHGSVHTTSGISTTCGNLLILWDTQEGAVPHRDRPARIP
eukprot:664196-Prymnesium_polylepis.1